MEYSAAEWRGTAEISPADEVRAGSYGTWTIRYRTGVAGIDEGGRIRIAWRSVSDWPSPQFDDPGAANYVSARTSGNSMLVPSFGGTGIRPWSRALTLRIMDEALAPGDEVIIVLGDTAGGSPGMRSQTHPESPFHFKLDVDPFGTAMFEPAADLTLEVIGNDAETLEVVAPSDAVAGQPFRLQVRALDVWGNPDPCYDGTVSFESESAASLPARHTFDVDDAGVRWFDDVVIHDPEIARVTVSDTLLGQSVVSNPIAVHETQPSINRYWGDIHGQTEETVGTGTIPGFFEYARDIAGVQVAAHQGNDFQITPELWEELCRRVEEYHEPGQFVTFHGYEWSGNTTAGGDHNIYLKQPRTPQRSSHTQIEDRPDEDHDRYPITRLYESNRDSDDMLIVPHIGGRRADIQWHDPALEPAIEIASQWGRFEWFAKEALERGYKVGFTGGSDDHSARQGWSSPTLAHNGVRGGLTAFLAPELTRDAIWTALKSRSLYGTSGPRILIDLDVNGHPIGSDPDLSDTPHIRANVVGTAELDTVELRRGTETIHTVSGLPSPSTDEPVRVRLSWRGARNRGRSRALDWSGELRLWNGRLLSAGNYSIDNPLEGVQQWDESRIVWESHTCGDWDGVIFDIDGDAHTVFDLRTPAMSFQFTLADLEDGRLQRTGPMLEQQVDIRRLSHQPGTREISLDWRDEDPQPGVNAYWLWITQADGELAWTSPVYVNWRG